MIKVNVVDIVKRDKLIKISNLLYNILEVLQPADGAEDRVDTLLDNCYICSKKKGAKENFLMMEKEEIELVLSVVMQLRATNTEKLALRELLKNSLKTKPKDQKKD